MRTAYDDVMSIPIRIPDGIEMLVTLVDRRDPDDVSERTFTPILSREAIFRDLTMVLPLAAAVSFATANEEAFAEWLASQAGGAEGPDDARDGE